MNSITQRASTVLIIAVVAAALVFGYVLMTAPKPAVLDHNPQLTAIAKSAMPLITQASDYFHANNHYPADASEFRQLVKDPRLQNTPDAQPGGFGVEAPVTSGQPVIWAYASSQDKKGYQIFCRLTTGQALMYVCEKGLGSWFLVSKDGKKQSDIVLTP